MGLLDQMQPTPRNRMMGLLADALTAANDYANKPDKTMPGGMANPPLSMLSGLLSLPSLATTAQRASYGAPLTNAGQANVPFLKPETADALMMAPLSPRTALGAVGLAAGMGDAGAMRAATVWHGSPHKFDKFDASKIGTGEGAQAYGHGLYVAENPKVAEQYANMRVLRDIPDELANKSEFHKMIVDKMNAGDSLTTAYAKSMGRYSRGRPDEARALNRAMEEIGAVAPSNSTYKVDLPDAAISRMLNWDKPLSQQAPDVQAAFSKLGLDGGVTGQQAYRAAHEAAIRSGKAAPAAEKERQAAESLRQSGIPGIRYLDGGSRGAGQGSSNFVIFPGNEGLLQILERNGAPVGK
jgi:hypothetical protein